MMYTVYIQYILLENIFMRLYNDIDNVLLFENIFSNNNDYFD